MPHLFQGNPLDNLSAYRKLTESSLLVDISRCTDLNDPQLKELGDRWQKILCRQVAWKMAVEKTINFHTTGAERMSIFSEPDLVLKRVQVAAAQGHRRDPAANRCGQALPPPERSTADRRAKLPVRSRSARSDRTQR